MSISLDGWVIKTDRSFEREGCRVFEWVGSHRDHPPYGVRFTNGKTKNYMTLQGAFRAANKYIAENKAQDIVEKSTT